MEIEDADLRVFSDIGTSFESSTDRGDGRVFRFIMGGEKVILSVRKNGMEVDYTTSSGSVVFGSTKALFASEHFGDLRRWAANQEALLKSTLELHPIETQGLYQVNQTDAERLAINLSGFDAEISRPLSCRLHVIVIDGPAGIGKSTQIRHLAYSRARGFGSTHERLILHVESRGRVLQNINDLIAASLQNIRAKPTYDQLAVLVKHGLVTLAIDGFDELADPNGYQLAWAQVNAMLADAAQDGQVILAGRETFVSPGRMWGALPVLAAEGVVLSHYALREVAPDVARNWLKAEGWDDSVLSDERLRELLSPGSYALRPFFLTMLSGKEIFSRIVLDEKVDLLSILVSALIGREVEKFGADILRSVTSEQLHTYLRAVSEEIARDMADNQGEVLPGQSIAWIAEICLPSGVDPEIGKTLVHRAAAMPFLIAEGSHNAVRFAHRQYLVFFLGSNAIRTIGCGEVPKYVRRNILGAELLDSFGKALRDISKSVVKDFRDRACEMLPGLNRYDRSAGNVASLLLTGCCEFPASNLVKISGVAVDEVLLYGEVPPILLEDVTISSLYAQGADLTNLRFEGNCNVISLHASAETLAGSMPVPVWIETGDGRTLTDPEDVENWLQSSTRISSEGVEPRVPFDNSLLERILRYRPFWLRDVGTNDDPAAHKILSHSDWPAARQWLEANDLARFEERQPSSGKAAVFIHFRMDRIRVAAFPNAGRRV